jgi:hypothetical protein
MTTTAVKRRVSDAAFEDATYRRVSWQQRSHREVPLPTAGIANAYSGGGNSAGSLSRRSIEPEPSRTRPVYFRIYFRRVYAPYRDACSQRLSRSMFPIHLQRLHLRAWRARASANLSTKSPQGSAS